MNHLSKNWKIELEFRTTVVPTYNYDADIIERIVTSIPRCDLFILQQFSPQNTLLDPACFELESPKPEDMRKLAQVAKNHLENVMIKTVEDGEEFI